MAHRPLGQGRDDVAQGGQRLVDVFSLVQDGSRSAGLADLEQTETDKDRVSEVKYEAWIAEEKQGNMKNDMKNKNNRFIHACNNT